MLTLTMLRQELLAAYRYVNRACWDDNLPEPFIIHILNQGEHLRFEKRQRPTFLFSKNDALKDQGFQLADMITTFGDMKKAMSGADADRKAIKDAILSFEELRIVIK